MHYYERQCSMPKVRANGGGGYSGRTSFSMQMPKRSSTLMISDDQSKDQRGHSRQTGNYQRKVEQQTTKLPQTPSLRFDEAISLASQRLTETYGRSRRSEYWWWQFSAIIAMGFLLLIPHWGNLAFLIYFILIYGITLRRLNDVFAPEWIGTLFLLAYGMMSCLLAINTLAENYIGIVLKLRYLLGIGTFFTLLEGSEILCALFSVAVAIFAVRDSCPAPHPQHGDSPKYAGDE